MKTLSLAVVVLLNVSYLVLAAAAALTQDLSPEARLAAAGACVGLATVVALLGLAWAGKAPRWGSAAMLALCLGIPLLWLWGSFDNGIVSGQEWIFVGVSVSSMWATWAAFSAAARAP